MTEVGWSARERAAQSTLKRAAVQPEVNLHREPGVLDRAVQIASTSELDVAADRAQRGAAAELERAVSFHGAVDRLVSAGRPDNLISRLMNLRSNAALWATRSIGCQEAPHVGSMNCERSCRRRAESEKPMDPFGITAVVITESGGLDIAKRHGRRHERQHRRNGRG